MPRLWGSWIDKFHDNVRKALAIVDRRKVFMFQRRARAYREALKNPQNSDFAKIEGAVKTFRTHRNAIDFDASFIKSSFGPDELR